MVIGDKHRFQVINTILFTQYRMHLQGGSRGRRVIEGARHICRRVQLDVQGGALLDPKRVEPGDHRRRLGHINRDAPLRHIELGRVIGGENHLQRLPIACVQNSSRNRRVLECPRHISNSIQLQLAKRRAVNDYSRFDPNYHRIVRCCLHINARCKQQQST